MVPQVSHSQKNHLNNLLALMVPCNNDHRASPSLLVALRSSLGSAYEHLSNGGPRGKACVDGFPLTRQETVDLRTVQNMTEPACSLLSHNIIDGSLGGV